MRLTTTIHRQTTLTFGSSEFAAVSWSLLFTTRAAFTAFLMSWGSYPGHTRGRQGSYCERMEDHSSVGEGENEVPKKRSRGQSKQEGWEAALGDLGSWQTVPTALPGQHLCPGGWRQLSLDTPQPGGATDSRRCCSGERNAPPNA